MLNHFETSLMRILIDKFGLGPDQVTRLLAAPRAHGGNLVQNAVAMSLADSRRLCHLLCQYWEKPFFDLSFPYRHFLVHARRPVADFLEHDLLPLDFSNDAVVVVACYVPEDKLLAELAAKHGKPILLVLAEAQKVREALEQIHDRIRRLETVGTRDCGTDKKHFVELAANGWPALVHETFAGGIIRVEMDDAGRIVKTLESLDPSEPPQLVDYLVGKSMTHQVKAEDDIGDLVNSFVQSIVHFEGELKEAILRLRVAPLLLEDNGS